ncbi:hypothetical protein JXA12_05455 [Candidatus Woesearchaeota archaeon]|nr:hypothetical protein [Candidatus Woesearchaeota archaeon]
MAKRKREAERNPIIIHEHPLPEELWGADIHSGPGERDEDKWYVAIFEEGKQFYQVCPDGNVVKGRVPKPGRISLEDAVFEYDPPRPGEQVIDANVYLHDNEIYLGRLPTRLWEGVYEKED